jgi:hypothetical protein
MKTKSQKLQPAIWESLKVVAAERDQLRAENAELRASSDEHAKGYVETRKRIAALESEIDRLHARNAVSACPTASWHYNQTLLGNLESATARAERAEAELATERAHRNKLTALLAAV